MLIIRQGINVTQEVTQQRSCNCLVTEVRVDKSEHERQEIEGSHV